MQIVTLSGSPRSGSYTAKALAVMSDEFEAHGHQVTRLDMATLRLHFPGSPPTDDATRMKAAIAAADAVVLATPEYHGSISAALKLALENMGFPSALKEKPVAMLGVAGGRIGAIKSIEQLRSILAHVGAFALPGSVSIPNVRKAFDADGNCLDADIEGRLKKLVESLAKYVGKGSCDIASREAAVRGDSN